VWLLPTCGDTEHGEQYLRARLQRRVLPHQQQVAGVVTDPGPEQRGYPRDDRHMHPRVQPRELHPQLRAPERKRRHLSAGGGVVRGPPHRPLKLVGNHLDVAWIPCRGMTCVES